MFPEPGLIITTTAGTSRSFATRRREPVRKQLHKQLPENEQQQVGRAYPSRHRTHYRLSLCSGRTALLRACCSISKKPFRRAAEVSRRFAGDFCRSSAARRIGFLPSPAEVS